jgi:hypothetical protein
LLLIIIWFNPPLKTILILYHLPLFPTIFPLKGFLIPLPDHHYLSLITAVVWLRRRFCCFPCCAGVPGTLQPALPVEDAHLSKPTKPIEPTKPTKPTIQFNSSPLLTLFHIGSAMNWTNGGRSKTAHANRSPSRQLAAVFSYCTIHFLNIFSHCDCCCCREIYSFFYILFYT